MLTLILKNNNKVKAPSIFFVWNQLDKSETWTAQGSKSALRGNKLEQVRLPCLADHWRISQHEKGMHSPRVCSSLYCTPVRSFARNISLFFSGKKKTVLSFFSDITVNALFFLLKDSLKCKLLSSLMTRNNDIKTEI